MKAIYKANNPIEPGYGRFIYEYIGLSVAMCVISILIPMFMGGGEDSTFNKLILKFFYAPVYFYITISTFAFIISTLISSRGLRPKSVVQVEINEEQLILSLTNKIQKNIVVNEYPIQKCSHTQSDNIVEFYCEGKKIGELCFTVGYWTKYPRKKIIEMIAEFDLRKKKSKSNK